MFLIDPECKRCDSNADCVYDVNRLIFRCVCKSGYTGNGIYCTEICKFTFFYTDDVSVY